MSATLELAIGRTPRTAALFEAGRDYAIPTLPNITRAFAPMVREGRYEASEMAIATFLMAKAAGKPLVLLPAVLSARYQEGAMLCRADGPVQSPADLRGKRVGVRAYSQTTGMWLRGVLAEQHGVPPDAMRWVTFEDAHLAEYRDPPFAERAPAGAAMLDMLLDGRLDAAIFGTELPDAPNLAPVFGDPEAAGAAFHAAYGFMPVNHLLVARADVATARTAELKALLERLRAGGCPVPGRAELDPALLQAGRFCAEQGLIARPLTAEEIWAGTPPALLG